MKYLSVNSAALLNLTFYNFFMNQISKSSSYGKSPTSTTNAAADKKAA